MKTYYTNIKQCYECNIISKQFLTVLDNLEFEIFNGLPTEDTGMWTANPNITIISNTGYTGQEISDYNTRMIYRQPGLWGNLGQEEKLQEKVCLLIVDIVKKRAERGDKDPNKFPIPQMLLDLIPDAKDPVARLKSLNRLFYPTVKDVNKKDGTWRTIGMVDNGSIQCIEKLEQQMN